MYSDQDGDEFLRGWSAQLALRTLELSVAGGGRDGPVQSVSDLWGRRKTALQFLMNRSPDVAARVLLSPLFSEQTNPTLQTQLQTMCQHALDVNQSFWDSTRQEVSGEVPQEEVTFAAAAMHGAAENDGLLRIEDVFSEVPTVSSGNAALSTSVDVPAPYWAQHTAQWEAAAGARLALAQQLRRAVQPRYVPPPRQAHATLSLHTKPPLPNLAEKAYLLRGGHSVSFAGGWPVSAVPLRLDAGEETLLASSSPLPLTARTLQEQVQEESIQMSRKAAGASEWGLNADQGVIGEPDWAREEEEEKRSPPQEISQGDEVECVPSNVAPPVSTGSADAKPNAEPDTTPKIEGQHVEKTVLADDEELVIAHGHFVVRKKTKQKKKEEKPKPDVVQPPLTHPNRKRGRDDGEDATKRHAAKTNRADGASDPCRATAVSLSETPLLTRAELMERLQEWDIPPTLRDALFIGLEVESAPRSQHHNLTLPLTASETSDPTAPDAQV